jgi:phospholipase/lecithinase/hemolysin
VSIQKKNLLPQSIANIPLTAATLPASTSNIYHQTNTHPLTNIPSGPNWVDFLTTLYNESTIQTYNLAYGGATLDSTLVPPYEPTVKSLVDQIESEFLPTYGTSDPIWTSTSSLFAFFIGINDIGNTYWTQNTTLHTQIFNVYTTLLDELYTAGARNFLLLNVPPIERAPLTAEQGSDAMELEDTMITDWNERLADLADSIRTGYNGTFVAEFDYHSLMGDVLDDPKTYPETEGYKNTTTYCEAYEKYILPLLTPYHPCTDKQVCKQGRKQANEVKLN